MKTLAEMRDAATKLYERQMATFDKLEGYYGALSEEFEPLNPYAYADPFDLNVTITGDKAKLAKAFGILRRNGFVPDARPKEKDTSFNTHFRQTDGTSIYLSFSSTVCKRVQVGTRTVEEPVYEIQCDERPIDESGHEIPKTSPDAELPF